MVTNGLGRNSGNLGFDMDQAKGVELFSIYFSGDCNIVFFYFFNLLFHFNIKRKYDSSGTNKNNYDCMLLSCHVHVFQSESKLYIYLNVKEFLARSRCDI